MLKRRRTSLTGCRLSAIGRQTSVTAAGVRLFAFAVACLGLAAKSAPALDDVGVRHYREQVKPLLAQYCYDCHSKDGSEAGVALDAAETDDAVRADPQLWLRVIKQLRAGLMPPEGDKPSAEDISRIENWIVQSAFAFDPADPDPGRVTLRRLNRTEYHNTIRDLIGVDFDADGAFPPDDTGHGFDNMGDVLTVSPLLMEKYIDAAGRIIAEAVPTASRAVAEDKVPGGRFRTADDKPGETRDQGPLALSFYKPAQAKLKYKANQDGGYQLLFDISVNEHFVDGVFDYNKCRIELQVDGVPRRQAVYSWQGEEGDFHYQVGVRWTAGEHEAALIVTPLTPDEKQTRTLTVQLNNFTVRGPLGKEHWVRPANYTKFFPTEPPTDPAARRIYAKKLIGRFAGKAYRRPPDDATIERLVELAEETYSRPTQTVESGVAKAMVAILSSPRFLFREEGEISNSTGKYPLVDEYALASRLSYFLWSSMPDDELTTLASQGRLRQELPAQVKRMLADKKSEALTRNFVGQWLQARDIDAILINSFVVAARDDKPNLDFDEQSKRFRELNRKEPEKLTEAENRELADMRTAFREEVGRYRKFDLNGGVRISMRRETEMQFDYVVRENRPLTELIDCNYAFLNESLARFYGIDGVKGDKLRRVELPPDSHRGGILTSGTVLVVTSNPDRTSPVKRGVFILDNLLGMPPAPPPPNIPPLEDPNADTPAHPPTLRQALEKHRSDPLCASCHARMDPLGLAMENYNALGVWRETDRGEPVDATGKLVTGEAIGGIDDLKKVLVENHRREFYRCLTEKLLTYALGRGLDYHDVGTVDQIVARLEADGGRPAALVDGIVASAPFQKRRPHEGLAAARTTRRESADEGESHER